MPALCNASCRHRLRNFLILALPSQVKHLHVWRKLRGSGNHRTINVESAKRSSGDEESLHLRINSQPRGRLLACSEASFLTGASSGQLLDGRAKRQARHFRNSLLGNQRCRGESQSQSRGPASSYAISQTRPRILLVDDDRNAHFTGGKISRRGHISAKTNKCLCPLEDRATLSNGLLHATRQ